MNCPCHKMVVIQKAELQEALDKHKWYESERAGCDIGCKCAQLNFIEKIMPGWGKSFRDRFCKDCNKDA